jgi:predicted PhzF superfamily epimerase YddE/YHI9
MTPAAPSGSSVPAVLVEAFAPGPMQGNGAAVVQLSAPAETAWMQRLAASLQQSETAFLWRRPQGDWALRWFTPTCEVPLCGHATLAAGLALAHWGLLNVGEPLRLASRSGGLEIQLQALEPPQASLVLPSGPLEPLEPPAALERLLNTSLEGYWGSALGYRVALLPPTLALAELPSPAAALQGADRQGLVLMQAMAGTAPELFGQTADYQLRFFAPGLGIEEDPVTGSAHALVAPWWMQHLGRNRVVGWQCSSRRGGMLCEHAAAGLVRLTGTGHLLWDGQIHAGACGSDGPGWQVCQVD